MNRYSQFMIISGIFSLLTLSPAFVSGATDKPSPLTPPVMSPKDENSSGSSSLSGKVVETMNAGGYTYIHLEKKGKKTWVAVPEMKVSVGQQISLLPGQEMVNFSSKSLNRTFDSIIFSGGPVSAPPSSGNTEKSGGASMGSKAAVPPGAKDIKVEKATGADAYTVGEIYEKRTALHEKSAVVKGKVVKVSAGIMGKNWIHLQDGTGDAAKGTSDLVATTGDMSSVGDIVTVKGTVSKDKDFGSGYKYAVILENASIQR